MTATKREARPHPSPMASQARHGAVAQIGTCASRIVVPQEREKHLRAINLVYPWLARFR